MGVLARFDPRVRKRALAGLIGAVVLGLVTLDWVTRPPLLPTFGDLKAHWQPSEAWLYDRNGHVLDQVRVDFDARRLAWTPISAISPELSQAVIRAEDRRFMNHGGIDWLAIAGSLRARVSGQKSRGASTITMQLSAFLSPEIARPGSRSMIDKLRQARAAWAIESRWSKTEVLEAYLNLVPLRGEVQGVGAGALMLFGKSPAALDRREAAVMAALLPDPGAAGPRVAERACRLLPAADCPALQALADSAVTSVRLGAIDRGLAPHLAFGALYARAVA